MESELAEAIVTSADVVAASGVVGSDTTQPTAYDIGLQVHFPDGTTADIRQRLGVVGDSRSALQVGDVVPVRFDPSDHSHVELDP